MAFSLPVPGRSFRHPHRFHRGHFRYDMTGTHTGNIDRSQGKKNGSQEDPGTGADQNFRGFCPQIRFQKIRHHGPAGQPPKKQANGNPYSGQEQGLPSDDPL